MKYIINAINSTMEETYEKADTFEENMNMLFK